jgi:hypothetical protein
VSENSLPQVKTRKGAWQCGFCGTGNHDRCIGGIMNRGSVLECGCKGHPTRVRCLDCGSTDSAELTGWRCADTHACGARNAAKAERNPLREVLELSKADGRRARETDRLAGEARRRMLMERTSAQIQAAVTACGIDDELGHDVAADLGRPRTRPARKPRAPRATEGRCICGGANANCAAGPLKTKGGKFAPGHDASLKSQLKKAVLAGDEAARARMIGLGWEKFLPAQSAA